MLFRSDISCSLYYHFCLLTLWRPFIHHNLGGAINCPWTVCFDASKAVIALADSYDELFSLYSTPYFMPQCVYAAGIMLLELMASARRATLSEPGAPWSECNQSDGEYVVVFTCTYDITDIASVQRFRHSRTASTICNERYPCF